MMDGRDLQRTMDSVARSDEVKGGRWGGKSCISSGWRSCSTEWVTSSLENGRACLCAKRCWEMGNKWACDVEFPFSLYTRVRPLLLNSERQAVQGCLQNECVCVCVCVCVCFVDCPLALGPCSHLIWLELSASGGGGYIYICIYIHIYIVCNFWIRENK